VGSLVAVQKIGQVEGTEGSDAQNIYHTYVADIVKCQEESTARNAMIKRTAISDGPSVEQGIESVAGYKDTYTTLAYLLKGICIVVKCVPVGDKLLRVSYLEPQFDNHAITFVRGRWNDDAVKELTSYPAVVHDDQCDSIAGAQMQATKRFEDSSQFGNQLGKGATDDW
jgi:predicted phage terminase large subunit-like protein